MSRLAAGIGALVCSLALISTACGTSGSSSGAGAAAGGGGSPFGGNAGTGSGGAGASAGAGGTNPGGSGGTGAGGSAGAAAGGSGGSTVTGKTGSVSVVQTVTKVGGTSYEAFSVSAGFLDTTGSASSGSCTTTEQGSCSLVDCLTPAGTPDAGATPLYVSAGTISIGGTLSPVVLSPASDGSYSPVTGQALLFTQGATLTVQASGATVPAFSTTLVGVGVISVTSPTTSPGVALAVDRSVPFSTTWSGSSVGDVSISLSRSETTGPSTHSVIVTCTYAASVGSGSVPATLLGQIPAGSNGALVIYGGARKSISAGDWTVYVSEISGTTSALVTFQ